MNLRATTARRGVVLALVMSAAALLQAGLGSQAANADHATVTVVRGSAYGCYGNVGLFGGPPTVAGPFVSVTLPPGGSAPITATAAECRIVNGPAIIFTAGPTSVSTEGTTGPTGSVTSTATLGPINTSGNEVFTATSLSSTCSASESGVTGSTTVTGGTITLRDPNPDTSGEAGEDIRAIPLNPDPNTTYQGTVANVNDNFRAVFNEQIVNPDGSLTVNAYHLYLLGPTALGDVIAGQVVCGVTTQLLPTTTTSTSTSTTVAPTTTSSSTSTTVAPTTTSSSTSTTVAPTTTSSSTSTTVAPTTTSSSTSTTVASTTSTTGATTSTTVAATSTTVAQTTTTVADCTPGQDGAKPGYGRGDKNHEHCGPPGLDMRPAGSSSGDAPPLWPLLAGGGVLMISLLVPLRRRGRQTED